MENKTKEKILDEALVCFAENGYEGTLLRNIALRLGLSKSALYKHYKSKEDIWNALLDRMGSYYAESFGSLERLPEIPKNVEEFYALVMRMVDFTIHDEKIILTRKLLLTEQFRDERVKKLATEHFTNGTKAMFKRILEKMMENGIIRQDDPEMLAFAFASPITTLIHYSDREPEKGSEIIRQIEAFVKRFIRIYGNQKT